MRHYKIANDLHFGVCSTMTCWAYYLLYTMGITSGYYILETFEKDTSFPNYVLLYSVDNEYKICDLARQIRVQEELHKELFHIGMNLDKYKKSDLEKLVIGLTNSKYICQNVEDYFKEHTSGFIIDAKGIDDKRIFSAIPRVPLDTFLKREKNNIL